jgi:NADPH:quinone reductase-like Zn-dependent oxidoreductase
MKAVVFSEYGSPDVLRLEEVNKPTPKDGEALVKVLAASVNAADWRLVRADPFLVRLKTGLFKPGLNILGSDLAGRVEEVGKNVSQFRPGDEVFGNIPTFFGSFAEYACVPENSLAKKPTNTSFEEAAAVTLAGLTALQGLRNKGRIKAGQNVLINGASGGVGTFAVQIAKSYGAEVTAVCSAGNLDAMRKIGADHVIDYAKQDFTKSGRHYDLIFAVNGYHPISHYKRALKPNGIYVMAGGGAAQLFEALLLGPWISMLSGKRMGALTLTPEQKDLFHLKDILETGKIKPVIDRRYPLQEAAEAIRYVEKGHAKGKVVITLQ